MRPANVPSPSSTPAESSRAGLLAIAAITLVAFALRVYRIGQWSLWYDEGFTTYFGSLPLAKMFAELSQYESNPPGYYLIIHYWMVAFGKDELHVRLFSAIFGAASVPALYFLGQQLFPRRAALLAASFLAICSYHVAYGQEARTYTLFVFTSLVSMSLLIAMLKKPTRRKQIAYILATALLPYLHIYGTLVILTQNAWYFLLLIFRRGKYALRCASTANQEGALRERFSLAIGPARWIVLQSIVFVLLLPFLKIFFHNVHQVSQGFWIPRPTLWVLFQTPFEYTGWQFLIPDDWWQVGHAHPSLMNAISLSAVAAAAILCVRNIRRRRSPLIPLPRSTRGGGRGDQSPACAHPVAFLSLWILIILVAPFAYSCVGVPMFVARYAMLSSCALYLLVAAGLDALIRRHAASTLVLVPILVLSALGLTKYYAEDSKPHWRDAAAYIDAQAQSGDLVLISRPLILPVLFNYYSQRSDLQKLGITDPRVPVTEASADEILAPTAGHDRVWLIYHHDNDPQKLLMVHLRQTYTQQPTPFNGPGHWDITMYLFTRPGPTAAIDAKN